MRANWLTARRAGSRRPGNGEVTTGQHGSRELRLYCNGADALRLHDGCDLTMTAESWQRNRLRLDPDAALHAGALFGECVRSMKKPRRSGANR